MSTRCERLLMPWLLMTVAWAFTGLAACGVLMQGSLS